MFWFLTVNYKIGCHRKGCEFVLALVPISCISRLGWMLGTDRRPLGKNKQREKYYYEKWNINFPLSSLTGKSTWQGKKDSGKTWPWGLYLGAPQRGPSLLKDPLQTGAGQEPANASSPHRLTSAGDR